MVVRVEERLVGVQVLALEGGEDVGAGRGELVGVDGVFVDLEGLSATGFGISVTKILYLCYPCPQKRADQELEAFQLCL